MEAFLQDLLSGTTAPVLTALLLGLLTAISPCPLATNIAAVSYIGSDVADRKRVFRKGLAYTLGRTVSYTVLGIVLILILKAGASFFHLQKFLSEYGEKVLGPLLIVFGVFFLFADKINFCYWIKLKFGIFTNHMEEIYYTFFYSHFIHLVSILLLLNRGVNCLRSPQGEARR